MFGAPIFHPSVYTDCHPLRIFFMHCECVGVFVTQLFSFITTLSLVFFPSSLALIVNVKNIRMKIVLGNESVERLREREKKEKHQQVKIHRCTFIQFAKGLKSVQLNLFAIRQQTRRVFPHRHSITSSLGLSPSNKDYSSVITWQLHKARNNQIREIIHRTSTGDA